MSANNSNQGQTRTREEYKQAKAEELLWKKEKEKKEKNEKLRLKEEKKRLKAEAKGSKDGKTVNDEKRNAESTPTTANYKRVRIRLFPIWLRLVLVAALIFVSTAAGAVVGYGMLGGGKTADVFKESTWTHIRDLIDKGK